jgi:hypothetical protein
VPEAREAVQTQVSGKTLLPARPKREAPEPKATAERDNEVVRLNAITLRVHSVFGTIGEAEKSTISNGGLWFLYDTFTNHNI